MSHKKEDEKQENFFQENESKQTNNQLNSINPQKNKLSSKKRKRTNNENLVKNYYNIKSVHDAGNEVRKDSRIIFLRCYNNWVKATMINKYYSLLTNPTNFDELSVLDLCCGKGGDLKKFFTDKKIKLYVGADISEKALINAQTRLNKIINNDNKFNTKCVFIVEDLSDPNNHFLEKLNKNYYFDLVSCQFALHYHFETKEKLNAFLKNVTERLNDGGYFIGSIIDDNEMIKRLKKININYKNEKFIFGNEFYSVKFSQNKFNMKDDIFGINYGFYLEDSIDKKNEKGQIEYIDEYLIIFDEFIKLCEDYNLYLIEKVNFNDFYDKYTKGPECTQYKNLYLKMLKNVPKNKIKSQREIIQLYTMFAFQKGKPEKGNIYKPYLKNKKIIADGKIEYDTSKFE